MGESNIFFEILIFAMVAAFLVYRLRSVLGRRHGEERQRPNPFANQPHARQGTAPQADSDNVVHLPSRGDRAAPAPVEPPPYTGPISLEEGVRQIQGNDRGFDEKHFLTGAEAAFEMIVGAFAQGDTATLRPLLADDVYDSFAAAIRERAGAGRTLETRITGFDAVDLIEARMDGKYAVCTVKFATSQINVTRDSDGEVVEGDAATPEEVVDIWTFQRNVRSTNPNWLLAETRVPQ